MIAPPDASKTLGPLCPICNKPYNEHSWMQKQDCNRKMKREERNEVWVKEKEFFR